MKSCFLCLVLLPFFGFMQVIPSDSVQNLEVRPVFHGSLFLNHSQTNILIDPFGPAERYKSPSQIDLVLITDIHRDHFDIRTLRALPLDSADIVVPKAVYQKLPENFKEKSIVLNNQQDTILKGVAIKAIPMYNLPENNPNSRHSKGRGNGYLLSLAAKTIYISGDTEDIPEMRELKDIDIAFVCMNPPFTMDIHHAAEAVLEFKPKIVYPYHYRGKPDKSDIKAFKTLIKNRSDSIEVRLLDWYKK